MHFSCSFPDKTGVMCVFPCTPCETRMLTRLLKVKLPAKGYCPKVSCHHIQDSGGAGVLPPLPLAQARLGAPGLLPHVLASDREKGKRQSRMQPGCQKLTVWFRISTARTTVWAQRVV